uniref:Uncharacterized protein n=1 Tax=Panagrellus redivivus TaxID=6233 RepID=A0A7E4VJC6_PANRE
MQGQRNRENHGERARGLLQDDGRSQTRQRSLYSCWLEEGNAGRTRASNFDWFRSSLALLNRHWPAVVELAHRRCRRSPPPERVPLTSIRTIVTVITSPAPHRRSTTTAPEASKSARSSAKGGSSGARGGATKLAGAKKQTCWS